MKARRIGYARVSTKDQTLERQIKLLIEAGVSKDNIYLEKVTGRTLNRMKARRIGYARVSTKDQTLERQIKLLIEAGVSKDNIYLEKVTGRTLNRTKWKELLADLIVGDTLIVTELDRLGRNKKDILATFELLEAKGVYVEILNMPLLNTNNENEFVRELLQPTALNLLAYFAQATFELLEAKGVYVEILNMPLLNTNNENEFVRELLQPTALNLLAYFAQKEIELKKERQTGAYAALPVDEKGRKLSIKKNKVVGRPNKQENLSQEQKRYIEAWIAGKIKTKDCIKATGIGKSTLFVIKKNIIGGGV